MRPSSTAAALATIALGAGIAAAASVTQLGAGIRDARATSQSLAERGWSYEAEKALADRIDALADQFHELAEDGASMTQTAASLVKLIEDVRHRYTDVLEEMQAEVIRIDGDLEAVQDSSDWQQRELLAMRLLYRLNWVRYERAMRYEVNTGVRKRLLTQARDGFAEFLGAGDPELTVEALLGHGLASKSLREYATAIDDFRAALREKPSRDMATRVRIALVEALLSTDRVGDALAESERLLAGAGQGTTRSQALFLRGKSLLLALGTSASSYTPSRRNAFRTEAARVLEQLYGRGGYWKSKVVQLVDAGIGEPQEWADVPASTFVTWLIADSLRRRAEYDHAIRLYSRLVREEAFVTESLYGLGFCHFHEGSYEDAIDDFAKYLDAAGADDANVGQATYLRFKAAESLYLRAAEAGEDARSTRAGTRYLELMRDFVARADDHPYAFEAWFRLGEWHRDAEEFIECGEAFAKVEGEPAFDMKAGYLGAQCYVEAVLAHTESDPAPVELVRTAIERLDGFLEEAAEFRANRPIGQARLLEPLEAKAVVMAAAIVAREGAGTMNDRLARLAGFEQRFPEESELRAEVLSLRIVAYRSLGDLDRAGGELETLLALEPGGAYRQDSLKKLGIVFLKEASKREDSGDTDAAMRSRRVALRVYERLLDDTREAGDGTVAVAGLEKLVADLRDQVASP